MELDMIVPEYSHQELNRKINNVLYELNRIKTQVTGVIKPRRQTLVLKRNEFQAKLRDLKKLVAIGQRDGIRLAQAYSEINGVVMYYEQKSQLWFTPTSHRLDLAKTGGNP